MNDDELESLLRQRPPDEPDLEPRTITATARVHETPARHPALAPWLPAAVVLVVALVVGRQLGGHPPGPSSVRGSPATATGTATPAASADVIPWLDRAFVLPTLQPTEPPAAFALCGVDDLVMRAAGWEGATGSDAGGITLINRSANPCRLEQPVEAALLDGSGSTLARSPNPLFLGPQGQGAIGIPSGGAADASVVWANWCGKPPTSTRLSVSLRLQAGDGPSVVTLEAPVQLYEPGPAVPGVVPAPRCDDLGSGSTIGIELFEVEVHAPGDYVDNPCRAADVAAYSGPWGVAAGSWYADLVLFNGSGFDCELPTVPPAEIRDGSGRVAVSARLGDTSPQAVTRLAAGGTSKTELMYADWCTAPPAGPLSLDLALADGRVPAAPWPGDGGNLSIPPCNSLPGTPPTFYASSFLSPYSPVDVPADPGDSLPFDVRADLPPAGHPGDVLGYTITLTNATPFEKPINLVAECPGYSQRLLLAGHAPIQSYDILNCGPVGVLQPHASRTFAMELRIPADTVPGTYTFLWQLGERGVSTPKLQLPVR